MPRTKFFPPPCGKPTGIGLHHLLELVLRDWIDAQIIRLRDPHPVRSIFGMPATTPAAVFGRRHHELAGRNKRELHPERIRLPESALRNCRRRLRDGFNGRNAGRSFRDREGIVRSRGIGGAGSAAIVGKAMAAVQMAIIINDAALVATRKPRPRIPPKNTYRMQPTLRFVIVRLLH